MSRRLPSLTGRRALQALKRAGFYVHHQRGSHAQLKHSVDATKRVTVPIHGRELPRGTLMAIIKQAGLTVDEFLDYL